LDPFENARPVGYALARVNKSVLSISSMLLPNGTDATEAVAAVANELKATYVKVKVSRPVDIASLRQAGYQIAHPTWGAFMLKPLTPQVDVENARRLFGIGTDRFLISWLDIT
jgi:hypothetical protein